MKNTFKLKAIQRIAGIIALLAVIGFSMAACGGDGNAEVKLAGTTWKGEQKNDDGTTFIITLTFTTSEFQLVQALPSMGFEQTMKGTYTFDGNSGTLTLTSNGQSVPFEVKGSKLTIKTDGDDFILTKQ